MLFRKRYENIVTFSVTYQTIMFTVTNGTTRTSRSFNVLAELVTPLFYL